MEKEYTWEDLAKIGTPNQWMAMHDHYATLLTVEETANWFVNELALCHKDKKQINGLSEAYKEELKALKRDLEDWAFVKDIYDNFVDMGYGQDKRIL